MASNAGIVIVGGGHAGAMAARQLRTLNYEGPVTIVCGEAVLPYHRPPLSKDMLLSEADTSPKSLYAEEVYHKNNIHVIVGHTVSAVVHSRKTLVLDNGVHLPYGTLIFAYGGQAFRPPIPGCDDPRVLSLRSFADLDKVRAIAGHQSSVTIMGAGFIGLEVAAGLRQRNVEVTILEMQSQVLSRSASPRLATQVAQWHTDHGVKLRLNERVMGFETDANGQLASTLADGSRVLADAAIMGAGMAVDLALPRQVGCEVTTGIHVDLVGATSVPDVFAIGDCSIGPTTRYGSMRLESISSAQAQAKRLAATLADVEIPSLETLWFWTDQYSHKVQIAGIRSGDEESHYRGDNMMFHVKDGDLVACECVDSAREFRVIRAAMDRHAPVNVAQLADVEVPLAEIFG